MKAAIFNSSYIPNPNKLPNINPYYDQPPTIKTLITEKRSGGSR